MFSIDLHQNGDTWDSFIATCPSASNYHRWRWQSPIQATFGHRPYYLAAAESGSVCGVLPLFAIDSWVFGRSLVSVPFFSYGGVLAADEDVREALLARAAEIGTQLKVKRIELRQGSPGGLSWRATVPKVTMEVPLPATAEELWKRLSSGLRNKIRHGRKSGFGVQWGGLEDIRHFYPVFAANMRNLGTPVYPLSWFENLWRCSPEAVRILTLWEGNRAVAGAFLNSFRNTLELPWSASLPDSRKKYSQVFLYWTFLEWAIEQGFQRVDLGRCTPGGGTYEFKRHWVCEERPLYWYQSSARGSVPTDLRPERGQFSLAIRAWKRLPLFVANTLGPHIVRSIP